MKMISALLSKFNGLGAGGWPAWPNGLRHGSRLRAVLPLPHGGMLGSELRWFVLAVVTSFLLSCLIAVSPILAGGLMVFVVITMLATSRHVFFIYVALFCLVPQYLAFIRPGIPWVSPQRLMLVLLLAKLFLESVFSRDLKQKLLEKVRYNRSLWWHIVAFFTFMYLSVATSGNPQFSLTLCLQATLQWFLPFVACLALVNKDTDVIAILRLMLICTLIMAIEACAQEYFKDRLWTQFMPENFFETYAGFAHGWRDEVRNGIYRAPSIFSSQLSYAEFCMLVSPLALYFLTGRAKWDRVLGGMAYLACILGVFLSQSRAGAISSAFATVIFIVGVVGRPLLRGQVTYKNSVKMIIVAIGLTIGAGATLTSHRLHNIFLGGSESAGSNSERKAQWAKGFPKALQRPILGYGLGEATTVAGVGDKDTMSVDSYLLSLLCDIGFLGTYAFFGYLVGTFFSLMREYLFVGLEDQRFIALSSSFGGFILFRLVLSQFENHTTLFLFTAIAFLLLMQRKKARNDVVVANAIETMGPVANHPIR